VSDSFELTSQEKFLLQWLSKEDSSAYGECSGSALTALINKKLATTDEVPPSDWARVLLTEAGWLKIKAMREAAS
jgi:hypothetical protein